MIWQHSMTCLYILALTVKKWKKKFKHPGVHHLRATYKHPNHVAQDLPIHSEVVNIQLEEQSLPITNVIQDKVYKNIQARSYQAFQAPLDLLFLPVI